MGPSAMLPSSAFSSGFDLRLQGLYLRVSGSGRPSGPALLRRNNHYVETVGNVNEETVRAYIRNQEENDKLEDSTKK